MKRAIPAMLLLALAVPSGAKTITVDDDRPADFNNIQAALDAAVSGDTVTVADGRYQGPGNRDLDFDGKAITLRSENGPERSAASTSTRSRPPAHLSTALPLPTAGHPKAPAFIALTDPPPR
jgi:hypothetical protein